MKNTNNFHYERKPSRTTTKLTLFTIGKDEWDTKQDTGNSIVCIAICQKVPLKPKRRRVVKKVKSLALAIIELRLCEDISQLLTQSVSQSLENSVKDIFLNSIATC